MDCIIVQRGDFQTYDRLYQAWGHLVPVIWDRRRAHMTTALGARIENAERRRDLQRPVSLAQKAIVSVVVVTIVVAFFSMQLSLVAANAPLERYATDLQARFLRGVSARIEDHLCQDEHRPGVDFSSELTDFEVQILEIGVEPASDVEAGGFVDTGAGVVDAPVQTAGDLDESDAVQIIDARSAWLVAQFGGVAGDD